MRFKISHCTVIDQNSKNTSGECAYISSIILEAEVKEKCIFLPAVIGL